MEDRPEEQQSPQDVGSSATPPPGRVRYGGVRSFVVSVAILGLIVGGLWYWESRGGGLLNDSPYGVVELPAERNPTELAPLAEVGRAAPDFLLERPEGGSLRLSSLQGQPVLINFWATWCPPCRDEIPELIEAFEQHADEGLVVIGIDLQEPDKTVLQFAEEFGITYPLVIDQSGGVQDIYRLGGIDGLPSSFFIDESGVIRSRISGPMTKEMLDERLELILPGGSS